MSPVQASLQRVFIDCLQDMLFPLIKLTLYCGLGHSEFSAAVRRVFIEVATKEYGIRGRPANVAKIAAKTGLARKVVQKYRNSSSNTLWSPDNEVSPINTVIHYWRFTDGYCSSPGRPLDLPFEGETSFSSLVKRYAGDIPASTIRQELLRLGLAETPNDECLRLVRDFSFPELLDEDFLRNAAFAIGKHAETIVHNALMTDSGKSSEEDHNKFGRFERFAWSRRLPPSHAEAFRIWTREHGAKFIESADRFISQHEELDSEFSGHAERLAGVGLYFFESDS